MMAAEDLFSWSAKQPRRRVTYQETSREAWKSFQFISGDLDQAILEELGRHGADGAICQEVEDALSRSHQAVSGNLRHLVEDGYVEWSGEYGFTESNRKAKKWRLTPQASTGGNGSRAIRKTRGLVSA